MGMLLHNTLMEQEETKKRIAEVEKPVEVPKETEPEVAPAKRGGRRKTTSK